MTFLYGHFQLKQMFFNIIVIITSGGFKSQQLLTGPPLIYCLLGPHRLNQAGLHKKKNRKKNAHAQVGGRAPVIKANRHFFFFAFHFFETTENLFWVYQNGNFTPLKGPHSKQLTGPFSLNPPLIMTTFHLFSGSGRLMCTKASELWLNYTTHARHVSMCYPHYPQQMAL